MSKKGYNKEKYIKQQEETMDKLFEKIKKGIKEVYSSDKWQNHLETISKFHNYSHRNILLIEMQRPGASLVAGYKKWQTEFERQVKKGERAIQILMPIQVKKELVERDNKGKPILDEDGNVKKLHNKFLAFKYTNVFDVSQTEGKELELFKLNELKSTVDNKDTILEAIKEIAHDNNCSFRFDDTHEAKGYYSIDSNEIVINEGMSDLQTLKTAVHELTHSIIHNPNKEYNQGDIQTTQRTQQEVEAESVAYVVMNNLGLDTSDYSFGYIASWSRDKSEDELSGILENIKGISSSIISKIEGKLEFQRNLDLQTCKHENKQVRKLADVGEKLKLEDILNISKNTDINKPIVRNTKRKTKDIEL